MTETATLEEDKNDEIKEFSGATLQISSNDDDIKGEEDVTISKSPEVSSVVSATSPDSNFTRNNPNRASTMSRTSIHSTASRISLKPGAVKTDVAAKSFYCYKESQFDRAVENSKYIIKPELDGELRSSWLLSEIDHWDLEREKVVLLTDNSIFIVKYNFINEKLYEYRRIMLHIMNSVGVGDFKYPNSSLMPDRRHGGIKISWCKGHQLTFGQKWNPWCTDIPWCILSNHPLIYNPKENETATYNVDEFFENLIPAVSKAYSAKRPDENLKVIEGPIEIESYASPISMVFNHSNIGFFRDRNGVSF